MHDLRILNGTVVSDGSSRLADVAVASGLIVDVAEPGRLGPARVEIDATGRLVLPGVVDVHFHCRAPSHSERGDFDSETRAAAAGGVTTVFEMPISLPACSTPEVLDMRRRLAERDAWVNVALFAGGAVRSVAQAEALLDAGAVGFKLFTTRPPIGREAEFAGLCAPTHDLQYMALASISSTGATCTVHAEDQGLLDQMTGNGSSPSERPTTIESAAITSVAAMAHELGTQVHFAHVTTQEAADVVRDAQSSNVRISAETSPHYLLLDSSAVDKWRGYAKVAPPLGQATEAPGLWQAVRNRVISVIASDHAPFLPEEKERSDWSAVPSGIPGVELMLPLILDAAHRGALSLEDVSDLLSAAPAKRFGLYPAKGTVALGSDADLVIYDPAAVHVVAQQNLFSRAARSMVMYEGLRLQGRITDTLVNGHVVFSNDQVLVRGGRFIPGRDRSSTATSARA